MNSRITKLEFRLNPNFTVITLETWPIYKGFDFDEWVITENKTGTRTLSLYKLRREAETLIYEHQAAIEIPPSLTPHESEELKP